MTNKGGVNCSHCKFQHPCVLFFSSPPLQLAEERNIRVVIIGVLTVAGLAVLGVCLYFLYIHHKRIKALLQPPLDIPEHFEEVRLP